MEGLSNNMFSFEVIDLSDLTSKAVSIIPPEGGCGNNNGNCGKQCGCNNDNGNCGGG